MKKGNYYVVTVTMKMYVVHKDKLPSTNGKKTYFIICTGRIQIMFRAEKSSQESVIFVNSIV